MMKKIRVSLLCLILSLLYSCGSDLVYLAPLAPNASVLAFGDSLTAGFGASPGQGYPEVLASSAALNIFNAGISGELSREGLERLPELLAQHRPQLVILCHGGNDLLRSTGADAAKSNILAMIAMVQAQGAEVLLLGVPRPGIFLSTADFYAEIAEQTQVAYVPDLIRDVLSDAALKSDAAHPNSSGYRVIAGEIESYLMEAGAI
jgi:lysophospholipase L1-like esterase